MVSPALVGGPLDGLPLPHHGPDDVVLELAHDARSPLAFAADAAGGRAQLAEPALARHRYIRRTWRVRGPHPCLAGLTVALAVDVYMHASLPDTVGPGRIRAERCSVDRAAPHSLG